MGTGMSTRL